MWDALGRLSPDQRAVVVMRYYLGYSESRMAAELGRPIGTVRWRLHAAQQRLRQLLGIPRKSARHDAVEVDLGRGRELQEAGEEVLDLDIVVRLGHAQPRGPLERLAADRVQLFDQALEVDVHGKLLILQTKLGGS